MPADDPPVVGSWYETEDGALFKVLAIDRLRGLVDIQYSKGRVEQLDVATWSEFAAQEVDAPEEWHGSMDDFLSGRRRHE